MKTISLFTAIILLSLYTTAQNTNANQLQTQQSHANRDKQYFIENKGHWHPDVLYLTRIGNLDVWITRYGVNYNFHTIKRQENETTRPDFDKFDDFAHENDSIIGHRVLLNYIGHNTALQTEGKQKQEGYYNYLIGNDPSKHASYVGLYKEAIVKNVYNGIDLRYYFDQGMLRYDYIVHPGADPSQIKINLQGQYSDNAKESELSFTTRFGEVKLADLKTYQDEVIIASSWSKQDNTYSIQLGDYDHTKTLIIDPLIYSTYIGGGSGEDIGYDITVDSNENAYITGFTESPNYDITSGAYQITSGGGSDAFVTKLNATGTSLIYSTYIGGSNSERGEGISIDNNNNPYITGYTRSTNFAVTSGAFQTTYSGGTYIDAFVTKLNTTGTALIYSTYIGGTANDHGCAIAIDSSGNAYITGYTWSTDYDLTAGVYQTSNAGYEDVFVTKLNASGTAIIFSTLIGGSDSDGGEDIVIDNSGNSFITGITWSGDYDITAGVFQTSNNGVANAFVTKLNANGTTLIYSTYIGGTTNHNSASSIAIDANGNAIITGNTGATDYPTTIGAYETTYNGGYSDCFITKLNNIGTALLYSTYIGGDTLGEGGIAIAIDNSENIYITGLTRATDYDVTTGAFQTTYGGGTNDAFVTKLGFSCNTYATIFPSACVSYTSPSGNYAWTSTGTYMDTIPNAASCDSIITINLTINNTTSTISPTACVFYTSPSGNYTWSTNGTYMDTIPNTAGCDSIITINLTIGNTTSTISPSACYSLTSPSGNYAWTSTGTYLDTIPNAAGCDSIITINLTINSSTTSTISPSSCVSYTSPSGNYTWTSTGTYLDTIPNATGCDSIITINLAVNPLPTINVSASPANICSGSSSTLTASGANTYDWSTGGSGVSISVSPATTDTYTVTGTDGNGCSNTSSVIVNVLPSPQITLNSINETCDSANGNISALVQSSYPPFTYLWSNGMQDTAIYNLSAGTYSITISDSNGCSNTENVTLINDEIGCDYYVYVPNLFSPNGDGNNDVIAVISKGVETLRFSIYNRWGNKVFETTDIQQGWNGEYKGIAQNSAVFIYILTGTFLNGESFEFTGDVSLIR